MDMISTARDIDGPVSGSCDDIASSSGEVSCLITLANTYLMLSKNSLPAARSCEALMPCSGILRRQNEYGTEK